MCVSRALFRVRGRSLASLFVQVAAMFGPDGEAMSRVRYQALSLIRFPFLFLEVVMSGVSVCPSRFAVLRLAEERACAGYLSARRSMVGLAGRVASVGQLVRENPRRADYRMVLRQVSGRHGDAVERTRLAYNRWQRARLVADAYWTACRTTTSAVAGRVA